jgi:hypothetical protein
MDRMTTEAWRRSGYNNNDSNVGNKNDYCHALPFRKRSGGIILGQVWIRCPIPADEGETGLAHHSQK